MMMTDREWKSLWMEEWKSDPNIEAIYKMAEEYHERCEAYDRIVCTGPIVRDSIMPRNPREMVLINKHARKVLAELSLRADELRYSRIELNRAIQKVSRDAF